MNISKLVCFLAAAILCITAVSCKKDDKEQIEYWRVKFRAGNFSINDETVRLTQDASTINRSLDFIKRDSLPEGNFSLYKIKLYFPTLPELYDIKLEHPRSDLKINNIIYEDLFEDAAFIETMKIDSLSYAVYELTMKDDLNLGNKENLNSLTFYTDAIYTSKKDAKESKRVVESNIYIKN